MNGMICRNGDFEGYGGEFQRGIAQIFMISVDAAGETEWIETFSGSGREFLNHMIPTQSGGFLLSGSSSSYDGDFAGVGSGDNLLIKVNQSGEKEWVKKYSVGDLLRGGNGLVVDVGSYQDFALIPSPQGYYIIYQGEDIFLLEIDEQGQFIE